MSNQYTVNNVQRNTDLNHEGFYSKVLAWLALSFGVAAVGTFFIGPLVPQAFIMPLSLIAIGALIAASFSRKAMKLSGLFAVVIPFILGITLYPTLNYYISSGSGNIVSSAAAGTALIFGVMATVGWTSKKSLNHLAPFLFWGVLGLIGVSLMNVFLFQLTGLSLIISIAVVAVFAVYTYIDIQAIRDRSRGDAPASYYALNVFLDIWNIFVSLLNILGIFSKN